MRNNFERMFKYKDLLKELVLRDLKLKYRRSVLGYFWSILSPLLIMIVLYIVFSNMFRFEIENYPVYLISGQMIFNYMSSATTQSIYSITDNGSLLKKTYVPKYIFTIAKITSGLIDFLFSLGAMFIVMIFTKAQFCLTIAFIPIVAIQLYAFCIGIGLLLACTNVFFRDIQYIYGAFMTAWMYCTPIFYPFEIVPNNLKVIIETLNPMYGYITQFRYCVMYGELPPLSLALAGIQWSVVLVTIGYVLFMKNQNKFILYI